MPPETNTGGWMALTDTQIKSALAKEKPYRLSDAKGLYIEVSLTVLNIGGLNIDL